jgi:hypothetical protein
VAEKKENSVAIGDMENWGDVGSAPVIDMNKTTTIPVEDMDRVMMGGNSILARTDDQMDVRSVGTDVADPRLATGAQSLPAVLHYGPDLIIMGSCPREVFRRAIRIAIMKIKIRIVAVVLLFGLLLFARSGKISFLKVRLLSGPDMLSSPVAELKGGDMVDVLEEKGGFAYVRTAAGSKGYINLAALKSATSKGITGVFASGKGVSDKEVAEGAKGWNPEVEKKVQGSRDFNFADMEWVAGQTVPPTALKTFVKEGNLK